ncbi:HAMP domain-containing histidine kinase [Leuconostoc gelidum subsp. gasicomitatum]|uniref:sensor histidine kinase n=1 Tax=Leuconostoc gasicomitatum TaxID=115778 RepID=UPI0007DF3823|nr:HAMP domain-containing sensor histidine kinase [Leuconostoc gasicomitatum]MBZ5946975.1 HAMP domain-containing histidine kinase [Leuconostoc gasicomitatum]CUW19384.1 Two-component system histidine kinase [Leuconostoc gasicomitatum]
MAKEIKTIKKASRRFSLSWQLSLGMASGFFVIFGVFAIVVTELVKNYYSDLPNKLYLYLWLIVILGGIAVFIFTFIVTRYILRPVKSIETTIEAFEDDPMTIIRAEKARSNDEFSDLISVLNRMIDRLQSLIAAQQQFVSDVSHELRTPVAIVKGHMDLLNRWGKDEPDVLNDSIVSSLSEMQRMENLINEMLNLTRAEQIPIENVKDITEVGGLVHRVFDNFKMIHPDFIFTFDDDLMQDANVKVRQDHMEQILIILADNAVKYSLDRKEIHFALSQTTNRVEIGIQDFGEGLSSEEAMRVFDRFYRVDKARSRAKGGNGLGLSIAQRLVEAYGGEITIESALGSGSAFTIRLPLYKGKANDTKLSN